MVKVSVHSVHFNADEKLITFIENKLNRLSRYLNRPLEAEVFLKLQDTGSAVKDKITEVKVHVPGGWMIDKKVDRTFEGAITSSFETLKRQIIRFKERKADH